MSDTLRNVLRFLFSAIGLLVASRLVPGIQRGAFAELVAVAVLLGALNATLGLLLKRAAIIPMVCSFGCLSLFINGLVFWLAGAISLRLGRRVCETRSRARTSVTAVAELCATVPVICRVSPAAGSARGAPD